MKIRIPIWVRFTDKCPLKPLGIDSASMKGSEYSQALKDNLDRYRDELFQIEKWAEIETQKRRYCRSVWKLTPPTIRYGFPETVYQNPRERDRFLKIVQDCLNKYSNTYGGDILERLQWCEWNRIPEGFGTGNVRLPNHNSGSKMKARAGWWVSGGLPSLGKKR